MAVSSKRSSSPSLVTSRSKPDSRNSDINNTVKSFSGKPLTKPSIVPNPRGFKPVTAANSPSDFPQRQSIGKESGVPSHHNDKENLKDKNAKPVRTRSRAVSKGTKNFTSLTISAASKIVACPRKKVLLEKNELVRTSLSSFSDGKNHLSSVNLKKDQNAKPARIRSRAVSKVTKNFMSLTISAASKIVACPRKKVFLEKNELVQTSLSSFSDGKSPVNSVNLQEVVEDSNSKPVSSDSTFVNPGKRESCPVAPSPSPSKASKGNEVLDVQVPLNSKNDSESLSETITMESDCVGTDVCSKTRPCPSPSSTSIIAQLEADPSLPPYDPKTNYLAPQPQFLNYEPIPIIQKLLNKEPEVGLRECKRVEDSFTSESPSDTETTEDLQRKSIHKIFSWGGGMGQGESFSVVIAESVPSDFAGRHFIGKESGGSSHHYDKENEKDQNAKPVSIRSPAVSKGTKDFMSLTISAASKLAAFPGKKVLLEKNELVRTSLSSFSDGKSPLSSVNLQEVVEDSNSKSGSFDSTVINPDKRESCPVAPSPSPSKASKGNEVLDVQVPLSSKNDSESLSETITMESDCVGIDVCSKTRPSPSPSSTSIIAPLEADPSLAPYDPETNYLAPRPQFLYYKPNPRIQKLLDKKREAALRECKRVEDSFNSKNLSDTDPSLAPYDPETNYLAPRPQFLYYKPNPRIQKLLEKKRKVGLRECKRAEDSFSSESMSDTETTEETQSEASSSVELIEGGQNEEEEEREAALSAPAQEEAMFLNQILLISTLLVGYLRQKGCLSHIPFSD